MPNGISFADAEASYNDADVCIYGIPYDHTSYNGAGQSSRRC